MTNPPEHDSLTDAMIFTTARGPMLLSPQHPHPQPVTDPELLAILFVDEAAIP